MMKNRYSQETGHYHWRCCVASDDVEGQGSSSGEGSGGEGEGRMRRSMRWGFCRLFSGVNQKSLLLPKNREGKVGERCTATGDAESAPNDARSRGDSRREGLTRVNGGLNQSE